MTRASKFRETNVPQGGGRFIEVRTDVEMAAFDDLPLELRGALNDAWFTYSPSQVRGYLTRFSVAKVIEIIRGNDRMRAKAA